MKHGATAHAVLLVVLIVMEGRVKLAAKLGQIGCNNVAPAYDRDCFPASVELARHRVNLCEIGWANPELDNLLIRLKM